MKRGVWRRMNVNRRAYELIPATIIERMPNGQVKVLAEMRYGPTLRYISAGSLQEKRK